MKQLFIVRLFTAIVEAATSGNEPAPLTSEKLTALNAQYAEKWAAMIQITDPRSKEAKDAKLALWKIDGEIKAEEAAILKSQNDAKVAEMRNQRLQLNQKQLDAYATLIALRNDKKADPAKLAQAETDFATAKEAVDNELLAKYASSKSAKAPAADGTAPKSDVNTAAIVELHLAGKSNKEIEDMGYKRSTVWHAINNYKKANAVG